MPNRTELPSFFHIEGTYRRYCTSGSTTTLQYTAAKIEYLRTKVHTTTVVHSTQPTHTALIQLHTYVYGSTFVLSYFRTSVQRTSVLSYFRTSEIVDIVVLSYLRNMKLLRRY